MTRRPRTRVISCAPELVSLGLLLAAGCNGHGGHEPGERLALPLRNGTRDGDTAEVTALLQGGVLELQRRLDSARCRSDGSTLSGG